MGFDSMFRVFNGRSGITSAAASFQTISPLLRFPPLAVNRGSSASGGNLIESNLNRNK